MHFLKYKPLLLEDVLYIFVQDILSETNIAPGNSWLEDDPFLLGLPIFRRKLAVSFRGVNLLSSKLIFSTIKGVDIGGTDCGVWLYHLCFLVGRNLSSKIVARFFVEVPRNKNPFQNGEHFFWERNATR